MSGKWNQFSNAAALSYHRHLHAQQGPDVNTIIPRCLTFWKLCEQNTQKRSLCLWKGSQAGAWPAVWSFDCTFFSLRDVCLSVCLCAVLLMFIRLSHWNVHVDTFLTSNWMAFNSYLNFFSHNSLNDEYVWIQHSEWSKSIKSYSRVNAAHTLRAYTLSPDWLGSHSYLTTIVLP